MTTPTPGSVPEQLPVRRNPQRRLPITLRVLAILAGSLAAITVGAPAAQAAPMSSTPLITYNMQGTTSGSDSKWTTTVGGYIRSAEIVGLQEAGATPPGDFVDNIVFDPNAPGRSGYVQHHRWRFGHESYEVYFLQTDRNGNTWTGGRTNVALVTHRQPDEVAVVTNPNPNGRNALGVRFGDNWYFTFHGLSMGGADNDSGAMLEEIADHVGTARQWTVMGDFNMVPGSFFIPAGSSWYDPGTATHQGGGEYDYAVGSEAIPNHPVRRVPGASADHYGVAIGGVRAAGLPERLRVLPLGDSITYGEGSSTTSGYRAGLWDDLRAQGIPYDFVGSQRSGQLPDTENEGHGAGPSPRSPRSRAGR